MYLYLIKQTQTNTQTQLIMNTKIKSNRTFGVEIELFIPNALGYRGLLNKLNDANIDCSFEGYTHRVMSTWKLVTDASLNTMRGYKAFELVSPICQGQSSIDQLKTILNILEASGCKVNKSCGIHVHVGINDFTTKNLTNLIKFYGKHQEEIDMIMQPSRRTSFNNRWAKKIDINAIWNNLNKCESFRDVENLMHTRYKVINVFAFRKYGTVEFRQHGGSIDAMKVCNWVALLCNMCDTVKKKANIQKSKGEFKHTLTEVFGRGQNRKIMQFFMSRANHFGTDVSGVFDWATTNRRV